MQMETPLTFRTEIKRSIRRLGFDVRRYRPDSCDDARMYSVLSAHHVNLVFDVGANSGQFGGLLRDIGYTGRIVSFEPLLEPRETLMNRSSGDALWEVAPRAAIGDQDGEIEIHIAANSVSSSVLAMLDSHLKAAPASAYIGSERLPIRRLDSIGREYVRADSVLFVKIDTQGFEYQVLDGAPELLDRAVGVQLELSLVPLYEGQCLCDELIQRLRKISFEPWTIAPAFADSRTGRLLAVDATFFRT